MSPGHVWGWGPGHGRRMVERVASSICTRFRPAGGLGRVRACKGPGRCNVHRRGAYVRGCLWLGGACVGASCTAAGQQRSCRRDSREIAGRLQGGARKLTGAGWPQALASAREQRAQASTPAPWGRRRAARPRRGPPRTPPCAPRAAGGRRRAGAGGPAVTPRWTRCAPAAQRKLSLASGPRPPCVPPCAPRATGVVVWPARPVTPRSTRCAPAA